MKLLFKLLWGIIGFVVILAVGAVILFAISTDNSKVEFDMTKEYRSFDVIVGEDLNNSLLNIKESNYAIENNKLTIGITDEEINYYIISMIRQNVNENYLDTDENIVKNDKAELKGIMFKIENDKISIKMRAKLSFYDTSINVTAKLNIDNKMLIFKLEDTKLGSLPIPIDFIKSMMTNMNVKLEGDTGFDPETFEFKMNMESLLKSATDNEILSIIINNCDYNVTVADSKLKLILNTDKIFMPEQNVSTGNSAGYSELLEVAKNAAIEDSTHSYSCTITEEIFNSLIIDNLKEAVNGFSMSFGIGKNNFSIGLKGIYYSIEKGALITNLVISDVTSPILLHVSIIPNKIGNEINSLSLKVEGISIGSLDKLPFDSFSIDDIPVSSLGFGSVTVKDMIFDKDKKEVTISGTYNV